MPEFTVNPTRFDPYKNFKFRIKWDGRNDKFIVLGIQKLEGRKSVSYDDI